MMKIVITFEKYQKTQQKLLEKYQT